MLMCKFKSIFRSIFIKKKKNIQRLIETTTLILGNKNI
jgi:hypothetical protein